MSTIGIWNLGSDAYDQTTNSIKSTLADHLPLENLSIHTSGRRALQKRLAKDTPFGDVLKSATQIYLAQYSCVIFVIDGDDPMAAQGRRQDPNSLINHIEKIVKDDEFTERVFLAPAVQELDPWLPIVRKSLEIASETWQDKWEDVRAHFHDAFADTPEEEVIRDFDAALGEVGREQSIHPKEGTMELTDILEFISPNAIHIKGTRVDIELVIEEFLFGSNPKRIPRRYPHLTPLQIYGSITYYLLNQERMDAYIKAGRAAERAVIEKYRSDSSYRSSPNVGSQYLKSSAGGSDKAVVRESVPEMAQVSAEGSTETKTESLNIRDIFEFISPNAIRIKGTRVGIEIVIERFLDGESPEEIRRHHPHLTPLQIYASVTYYLLNQKRMEAYIEAGRKADEAAYQEQLKNPSPGVARLMKIAAEAKAARLMLRELSE